MIKAIIIILLLLIPSMTIAGAYGIEFERLESEYLEFVQVPSMSECIFGAIIAGLGILPFIIKEKGK